ncbi:MAG: hypothetical protein M0D55_13935 [Elusimicrobiota bacterium]|nr:MAG: hypothetical protein M0D55_13935 [Elusimicrobiota bacterium]
MSPETLKHRSNAYARYYFAKQTLGREPIDRNFTEGWIELRLKDPGTPPEVLLALAKLQNDKADRLYRESLVGAAARADILAAQFEGDARLLRWVERKIRERDGSTPASELDSVRLSILNRLAGQRQALVARLGLPPETELSQLVALVPEDAQPAETLRELAGKLIGDIRTRQIDAIRRTLFDGGTPASWGNEDGIMQQIRANTIAERMSYRGFTPVATFGMFRGTPISGGFIEAPDPRQIEAGLEKVMSEVLRKEMQSTGRLQELTTRLHALMLRVQDGSKGLEARRRLIEAAENDLRARSEVSGRGSAEYAAAQAALVRAWDDFSRSMTATKADFITLVTELEALGEGGAGSLRPFMAPDRPERRAVRDTKADLLEYYADRFKDPSFESSQDALLARMGTAVPAELRSRIARAGAAYRDALRDREAVMAEDYNSSERLDRLTKVDVEGRRLNLRAEIELAVRGIGLLDPASNPVAAEFLAFMRKDLEDASKAFALDRGEKLRVSRALNETYWRARPPTDAEAATFTRLERLDAELEAARDRLLASYLADSEGPTHFVLKDLELDAYLKAQAAFDAELARALKAKPSEAALGALHGLYDLREVLDRSIARAKHGRGMAALDALIMLEASRLRAARWTRQAPARVDPIAEALSRLKETRERWTSGKIDELAPLYAVTRLDGEGRRTWSVDQWLTADQVAALAVDPADPRASEPGRIVRRDGKLFIDRAKTGTGRYEVIGGADAADVAREAASRGLADNRASADLLKKMETSSFVAQGAPGAEAAGWDFASVFGPGGLHSQGRVFFFEARADGKPARALHPLRALARPPEEVVIKVYGGDKELRRDRFPTLRSLETSEENGAFRTMLVSPRGAQELVENARRLRDSETRRGWIEVKLNSFGFARDEKGQVAQLYRTKDDFEAQWKAYDHAARDLAAARKDLETAKAEEAARKEESDSAKAGADRLSLTYQVAQARLREALRAAMLAQGLDERAASFKTELDRRVAEPKFSKLPKIKDDALRESAERLHGAYQDEIKAMDAASKAFTDANSKHKLAEARAINAAKAVKDAETTLARSGTWTLHRTSDLALGLDSEGRLVSVSASGARGPEKTRDLAVEVAGGGPAARTLTGALHAAVVDQDGRVRRAYESEDAVDAGFRSWTMRSYRAGGDVVGADGDEALTKVRFSQYEADVDGTALPVLLGENYLIERLSGAQSALWKSKHWSYLPYNWGNILLEIPRGVAGIPAEFAGRDPRQHHYLGRAYMYKTEGGATEHHGFFRTALGVVDVLNLLPDQVDRFYDPSQFPDVVRTGSALRPGEGLWDKNLRADLRGDDKNIHLGRQALQRQVAHAAEDLEAARVRTLSRFHGGVEQLTLETRRGRAGWYQESTRTADLGPEAISRRLEDGTLAADPKSDGRGAEGREGDVVTSATPGHLFVDAVERRVRVRPGADSYELQARALDGYGDRVASRGQGLGEESRRLQGELDRAREAVDAALGERGTARAEQEALRARWHRLAQRVGEQLELERRIGALKAEIAALEARVDFWNRYLRLLEEARRGGSTNPGDPNNPNDPTNPNNPRSPWAPNPMFWVWLLMLGLIGSIASALWHALRRRRAAALRPL